MCKCYWCRHQHHDGWPLFNVQRLHRSYLSCDVWGWMAFNYKQATSKISYLYDALYRPSCQFPQILHHNQRSTVLSKVLRVVARTRSSTSPPTLLSIILTYSIFIAPLSYFILFFISQLLLCTPWKSGGVNDECCLASLWEHWLLKAGCSGLYYPITTLHFLQS